MKRIEYARIAQGGACNSRRLSSALTEAIDECRDNGIDPKDDGATFLILHQLAWILTGHDIVCGDERMSALYDKAAKEVLV